MVELYTECHRPLFDPILINKWGFKRKAKIDKSKSYEFRRVAGYIGSTPFYETIRHLVCKVPEGCIVVASHNLEKRDPILIQCNNPTSRAMEKAKKVAKKMARKYSVDEFWLGEPSKILPWIELRKTSYDIDKLCQGL